VRQDPRDHCRLLDQRKKPRATAAATAREYTARAFAIVAESGHFARRIRSCAESAHLPRGHLAECAGQSLKPDATFQSESARARRGSNARADPEEIEIRRIEQMDGAAMTPLRAPDKRARRALQRLKGQQESG
jgi:hypothetical protein